MTKNNFDKKFNPKKKKKKNSIKKNSIIKNVNKNFFAPIRHNFFCLNHKTLNLNPQTKLDKTKTYIFSDELELDSDHKFSLN